jgi:hypothetical protein
MVFLRPKRGTMSRTLDLLVGKHGSRGGPAEGNYDCGLSAGVEYYSPMDECRKEYCYYRVLRQKSSFGLIWEGSTSDYCNQGFGNALNVEDVISACQNDEPD